ncbi:coiled-coil domain-containing protein 1-like [Benincasa hispida]|uniref:coiled-coil domain-containing protein 1-like n=1 Tax=Benincasa hispida TaxID=102211 RepID=UPI0019016D9C|nr:coiled-coil domain-containing protein 1-like [Benincasa hispida]
MCLRNIDQNLIRRPIYVFCVGYEDEKYGYNLYDPKKKKVVRSRDVVFFKHEKGADLLSAGYTFTSELCFDTTNDSTYTPVVQPTNENVDDVHDDVDEIQPDGNVPDHVDDDDLVESSLDGNPTNENVDDVHDDVDEIQLDGNVPDHVDDDNLDESSLDEEIHEKDAYEEMIHIKVREEEEQSIPQMEDTQARK